MTDINKNIRTVFLEEEIAEDRIVKELSDAGARVIITDKASLLSEIKNTDTHLFSCCVVGGCDFVEQVKNTDIRAIITDKDRFSKLDAKLFVECGRVNRYEVCEDAFIENEPEAEDMGHLESIFALGNGYLGMRGTYDERNEESGEIPGMYINGIFESEPIHHLCNFSGFAQNEQYTINLCDWRIIELYIDGEKASVSNGIKNHRRTLDFKRGEIVRTFEFTTKSGKTARVESVRIVNNFAVHGAEIKYTVMPINFDGEVELRSYVVKHTPINGKMTTKTISESAENGMFLLETRTNRSEKTVAAGIAHKVQAKTYKATENNSDDVYEYIINTSLNSGESVSLEKYAAFYSDEDDVNDLCASAEKEVKDNVNTGFDVLRDKQHEYWSFHWKMGDMVIEGNPDDQQAVRFSLFHLKNQLPSINHASIGATGLTGQSYSGKIFWDTEMYMMPYYLFTDCNNCKEPLMYRVKILDKARERARQLKAEGAIYSWCSIDGEETSVVFEASTAELHINSDIAYAVWQYEKVTGDSDFIYYDCAEMLFETAKYYAHRGSFSDAYDGRFCINAVCGPDEYACGVNNNCYTNFMVRFHFRYALDVYDRMRKACPEKLCEITDKIGLTDEELDLWKRAADNMYYRINEKYGIYEQDSHFVYNDAVDMATIPKNLDIRGSYHPLDLWRMQVLKQADVVLMQFILGDLFTIEEKKRNYDYYEPKTNHGSSLSAAIHSIMANEIDYCEDAYEYFRSASYMDINDFKRNTTGGLHMACLGGVWMSVVNGFMGMRLYNDGLHFAPKLPKEWDSCTFNINYKNAVMRIRAEKDNTRFTLIDGENIHFTVYGEDVELSKEDNEIIIRDIKNR